MSLNEIPKDWIETTLDDNISVIAMGPFGSNLKREMFTEKGVPIIKGTNLSGMYVDGDFTFVSEEKATSLRKAVAYPNDIIITHRGTIGQVSLVPQNKFKRYVTSQSQLRFSCNPKKLDYKYILYFLKSRIGQYELLKSSSQVGVPAIATPTKSVKEINLFLPSIKEQKAIANVLTAFDDKIELLQEQNQTLETIAQTVFIEWFGKYQIGDELPEGWKVGEFGELFDLTMGLSPKGDSYNHDKIGVPLLNGAGDYSGERLDPKRYTSKPTRLNKIGDLVFCIRGTIGKIVFADKEYCLGRGVAALSPKEPTDKYFNYIKLKRIIDSLTRNATGSVILGLSKDDIKRAEFIFPSRKILNEFSSRVKPIFDKLEINQQQIQSLTKTRDALLPKLMSGQVKVKL